MFKIHKDFKKTSIFIANLNLSELRLMNNQFFPWFILIIKRKVQEIDELDKLDQLYLLDEINLISKLIKNYFNSESLNIAKLGNITSQLHIHIAGRSKKDIVWPKLIWTAPIKKYSKKNLNKIIKYFKNYFKI